MKIFGLNIWRYRYKDFFQEITDYLHWEGEKWKAIFTPNPEICLKTLEDEEFLQVLQKADYLTSDGIGLYIGYQINDSQLPKFVRYLNCPFYIFNIIFRKKYLYKKYGERICGSDLTHSLVNHAQDNDIHIAIIDPYFPKDALKCESQESFREKFSAKFPELVFDLYVYGEHNSEKIFTQIAQSDAQILFSTLGMKKQEVSILKWLEICPNLRLWLAIGSSFDYYTWFQKRAPKLFRDLGFEWFYRIFTSPNKIQRLGRIYQALVVFPIKVLQKK